ncbi:bifunctional 5,10-methylenetetrahydrofolate dehydrogenase/5,10-methenyltetrahydrofolate cyclohydrolase [Eupransor demetentiae]|uniref:Bifunctional protein FolD n=1 Tax=Eupransor demetentiae TaxID=3109584 RepID=A0ABM9N2Y3_9LACO|nr:5 [Lactobacillaceae bacterium LMG 33000] [Lactobacillaceae bacterium LMG 33000]
MTEILDGKAVAKLTNEETAKRVAALPFTPKLAVIYDPENGGSELYVGMKSRKAARLGMETVDIAVPADADTASVVATVKQLNEDSSIQGILVQSPLPGEIDEQVIFSAVAPAKDVDGLGAFSQGLLFADAPAEYTVAATPKGVMTLLEHYHIPTKGKRALVVGRSQLFGRPMMALMLNADATVTIAHRYTPAEDLKAALKQADIVMVGVGIPNFIKGEDLQEGAVVVDVGMNVVDGKAVGDVDFASAQGIASYITPVPGGVGPMTIATLLENTVTAAELQAK